jgi:DNA-binding response OmpR family regulator
LIFNELRDDGSLRVPDIAKKVTTPVLILTARDAVEAKMDGLDSGADDYMTKPFFMGELISRLKALVRRSYQQNDPVVRVGDLEVDTNGRCVRRAGVEIDLSAREYALLEFLVRRQGKITSRTEIWDHVYENYGGASSNVVDVYIGYLRRKLHLPGLDPIIHTKRGQGYLLRMEAATAAS